MALITLLQRWSVARGRRTAMMLAALGLFGAALFFGDSMITPAISVLSAVEGLKVVQADLEKWIIPITAVIIVVLFAVQRHGTAVVGRFFGPVMILWFTAIGACGVSGIVANPEILKALSPTYALTFMFGHFPVAFFALAAVVLAVTGAEALYADMGHFSRRPIVLCWLFLVLPACVLSYFGQGALILGDESKVSAPFFVLTPEWARLPMVLLATAATVIRPRRSSPAHSPSRHRQLSSATCRGCGWCTPRPRRSARSTCRQSTQSSWSACWCWCSLSAVPPLWPMHSAWP
jgi:KUP system potassium uptake protein